MYRQLGFLLALLFSATNASAAMVLVSYTFDDPNDGSSGLSYSDNGSGVTSAISNADLGLFSVGQDNNYGDVLRTAPTSITFPTDHPGLKQAAIDEDWYYSVQLTRGTAFDLGSIDVDVGRGGSTGLRGFFVRSSLDAYASDLIYQQDVQDIDGMNPYTIDLTNHLALTDVTFRFYSYTNATGRYIDYGGLEFLAPSQPAPVTGTLYLISFAGLVGLLGRSRKKRLQAR